METNIFRLETLYAKTSTGKTKQWSVQAVEENGKAILRKEYGEMGGKMQTADKEIKGKNIGKKNETTPYEQAMKDAQSAWNKQVDKNYGTDPKNLIENRLPMLAHPWKKYGHKMKWPAFVQPKLNGVRCLAEKVSDGEINFTSRKGKSFNPMLQHLVPYLNKMMHVGDIFDGELFNRDWTFQEITRHVKKVREDQDKLEFWVYDMADKIMNQRERYDYLANVKFDGPIIMTPNYFVMSEKEMKDWGQIFVSAGYEGTIIRSETAEYKFDHRSQDLLKDKNFVDEEFTIVAFKDGEGKEKGAIIFGCLPHHISIHDDYTIDDVFWVRPKGSYPKRQKWYKEGSNFIHEKLTVRYLELSEDGIPTGNTVGIAVRDYE